MEHRVGETPDVGDGVGDQPGSAGPVQARRRTRLAGDRAKLRHRPAGAARHREAQPLVAEQGPAGRPVGAVHQRSGAGRQARVLQRWI